MQQLETVPVPVVFRETDRLKWFEEQLEARTFGGFLRNALKDAAFDFTTVRPRPVEKCLAPGACLCLVDLDLSDEAVELLLAFGADVQLGRQVDASFEIHGCPPWAGVEEPPAYIGAGARHLQG